ncbi:MAG TPA: hypothetical protein DD641_08195 [Deltaproteobacteria bacterium]|nr:hypothetical protein [Deltaproteobacteria bacterium]
MTLNIQHSTLMTAVLILGHGSPVRDANKVLFQIAETVKIKGNYDIVQPAFLQFEHPNFSEAVDILVDKGVKKIFVQPYFLYMGAHVTKDLPFEIGTAKNKYSDIDIIVAPHLGFHEKLAEAAVERIEEAMNQGSRITQNHAPACFKQGSKLKTQNLPNQHPIEAESFRIIERQLDCSRFSPFELPIVKRVIHTTADFEYADLIRFGNHAIEKGIEAIARGADIITDVRMVEVGINKERIDKFGGNVRCFISDKGAAVIAKEKNITKTSAAMQKAKGFINSSIVVIGNAPTALLKLIDIIRTDGIRPALVIGVPVGFVDAEESKEELMKMDVPYISIKGKKGGSTVAVAIVNAMLMLAEERLCHR